MAIEAWRNVWRAGLAPVLPTAGLIALRDALARDDEHLLQGATVCPPPLAACIDWPPDGCCPVAWCAWKGEGMTTVGEVEEFFARAAAECDRRMGEPAAVRMFLNAVDDWPRDELIRNLLPEVERVLAERGIAKAAIATDQGVRCVGESCGLAEDHAA